MAFGPEQVKAQSKEGDEGLLGGAGGEPETLKDGGALLKLDPAAILDERGLWSHICQVLAIRIRVRNSDDFIGNPANGAHDKRLYGCKNLGPSGMFCAFSTADLKGRELHQVAFCPWKKGQDGKTHDKMTDQKEKHLLAKQKM